MHLFNLLRSADLAERSCYATQWAIARERRPARRYWLHRCLWAALRVHCAPSFTWSTFCKYRKRAALW